ncbi:hypothetical protein BP6252_00889 [Coleophoma cylindrospora]|uniref:DUF7603 domain-containing protein n=1 Tax=Coleophoma cylindrospora TaxID=1849047 RepID=A0A3D8SRD5_9HELO|nr:hypothetical protein BP6252_00889 [Coleophoma cylindrospora]
MASALSHSLVLSSQHHQESDHHPSTPDPLSDTFPASPSSDLAASPINLHGYSTEQGAPKGRARKPSLSIRSRAFSSSSNSSISQVKRKPLPVTASPLAIRFSSGEHLAATTIEYTEPQTFSRPYSLDSPTLYDFPAIYGQDVTPQDPQGLPRNSHEPVALTSDLSSDPTPASVTAFAKDHIGPSCPSPSLSIPSQAHTRPASNPLLAKHVRLVSESVLSLASASTGLWNGSSGSSDHSRSATMSMFSSKATRPSVFTSTHAPTRSFSNDSDDSDTTIQKSLPKSPGASKLGSFFGWGAAGPGSPTATSPTTSFSDKAYSPLPASPNLADASQAVAVRAIPPKAIDIPRANADAGYFGSAFLQIPPATPTTPVQVEEMEEELKAISSELASSIRREMDLEDLVDRLQAEAANLMPMSASKRTSDYFSDAGTSSVRYGEPDSKLEELERSQRKTEQEKAQIQLELTAKVQEERTRRKQLEVQIRRLEDRASQSELASINSLTATGRLKEVEATCEDLRRRLAEEREVKDNFEDLLTALKSELETSSNERDNLRDEIVPQLRARVEGLEAQAAQHESLAYEQSKMQQELQTLKRENTSLINTQKMQSEMQMKKFNTIVEEDGPIAPKAGVLSRSNSLASRTTRSNSRPPSLGLQRSGSVKVAAVKTTESRDALAERVKDIELQRDALHAALKSLLERQEHQNRENLKKIRQLEQERDRALSSSPKRIGYDKEVANLRDEINVLRRRADEAIEQKWQCEKGLSGLKMDLDRAEQEIASLRSLLQEKDILIPAPGSRPSSATRRGSNPVSSESLEQAYRDLQRAYADSLSRINSLEMSEPMDAETEQAMRDLEQSLQDALTERDFAVQEIESLRQQNGILRETEKSHMGSEMALADELRDSAKRVEELATQVRQQLASNSTLRQRLTDTIARGEKEQKDNAMKIIFVQSKLKHFEEKLLAATQASEDTISRHEEEIRGLKEAHNEQLLRMKDGLRSPRLHAPKTPLTPMFANSAKAPRIMSTSSGKALSVSEDSKVDFLKQRVMDLESALADADREMEEVVGRMNIAQIEVMELQNEREEAVRQTKRLQKQIEEERVKAFENRFASLAN